MLKGLEPLVDTSVNIAQVLKVSVEHLTQWGNIT